MISFYLTCLISTTLTENAGDSNFSKHIGLSQIRQMHQEHSDHCFTLLAIQGLVFTQLIMSKQKC